MWARPSDERTIKSFHWSQSDMIYFPDWISASIDFYKWFAILLCESIYGIKINNHCIEDISPDYEYNWIIYHVESNQYTSEDDCHDVVNREHGIMGKIYVVSRFYSRTPNIISFFWPFYFFIFKNSFMYFNRISTILEDISKSH